MSSNRIQANYTALSKFSSTFMQESNAIADLHSQIAYCVDELSAGGWFGEGADKFYFEMYESILPNLKNLFNALCIASESTQKVSSILADAENEAAKLFQGAPWLASRGGGTETPTPTPTQTPTPTPTPQPSTNFQLSNVAQEELTDFFSQWDNAVPEDVRAKYLTNPQMMQYFKQTLDLLATRVQNGEAPMTPQDFYDLCLSTTNDPGTALILAHNVTKAMTRRDSSVIQWDKTSTSPLTYQFTLDGQTTTYTFDPSKFHADALDTYNGNPSVFYAMFSQDSLGTTDGGDWYHYYLNAAGAYYAASGQLQYGVDRGSITSSVLDGAIDGAMSQMLGSGTDSNAYAGWRYANALSYLEGAKYGDTQAETSRESQIHRQGALYGLELAGFQPDPSWRWYVTEAGSAGFVLDPDVDIANDTYEIYDPTGNKIP